MQNKCASIFSPFLHSEELNLWRKITLCKALYLTTRGRILPSVWKETVRSCSNWRSLWELFPLRQELPQHVKITNTLNLAEIPEISVRKNFHHHCLCCALDLHHYVQTDRDLVPAVVCSSLSQKHMYKVMFLRMWNYQTNTL